MRNSNFVSNWCHFSISSLSAMIYVSIHLSKKYNGWTFPSKIIQPKDNSYKKKHPSHSPFLNCLLSTGSFTLFLCSNGKSSFRSRCSTRKINSRRRSIWLIAFVSQSSITYQNILGRHVASDCRWSSGILQSSIFRRTNKCCKLLLLDFSTCLQMLVGLAFYSRLQSHGSFIWDIIRNQKNNLFLHKSHSIIA